MSPSYQSINHGQKSVGTAAVQLDTSQDDIGSVAVRSHAANAGKIYVGKDSTVTTSTGYQLNAGESVVLDVSSASLVWLISDTTAQTVSWVATSPA